MTEPGHSPSYIDGSDWIKLIDHELEYIKPWRAQTRHSRHSLAGIALSGGGIRAAVFSLGVLQALAARDLLCKFDYISTVSGGGYIGSALNWLTSRDNRCFGVGPEDFPFGTNDPSTPLSDEDMDVSPRSRMLRFLRHHGNYLAPGNGITLISALAVVLRGFIINLLVWVPLLTGAFALLLQVPAGWTASGHTSSTMDKPFFAGLMGLCIALCILFVAFSIIYSLATYAGRLPLRYRFRRGFERFSGLLLAAILASLIGGTLPMVHDQLTYFGAGKSAPLTTLVAGVGSALWTFMRDSGRNYKIPTAVIAAPGAALLIYGLLLISYALALSIYQVEHAVLCATSIILAAFAFGWLCNLNLVTLHRFYRDRLMEAFLPNVTTALADRTGPATQADSAYIQDVWRGQKPASPPTALGRLKNRLLKQASPVEREPRSPYQIINSIAVLVDSPVRKLRVRSGDSFMLTPMYCGSGATGWRRSSEFLGGKLSLPTAMAISGAAVNPNAEAFRISRNRFVAVLMNLLNLRLGYWVHHPRPRRFNAMRLKSPNHLLPGLYELGKSFGAGFQENRAFVQLSDGGNFDNLGIYELVRRRVKTIVACGASADPDHKFGDLRRALRLIQQDFGVSVDISDNPALLDALMPGKPETGCYPEGVRFSDTGYIVCTITYPASEQGPPDTGTLIYLNTTLVRDVGFSTRGYKASHDDFPDQSTVDQFFDEDQFEAYRDLGYRIATSMIDETPKQRFADKLNVDDFRQAAQALSA